MQTIYLSWLCGFSYCECMAWNYVHCNTDFFQQQSDMVEGKKIHEENKKDLTPISKEKLQQNLKLSKSFFWEAECYVYIYNDKINLSGKIDLIEEYENKIIIWDYKPKPKNNFPVMLNQGYINQLCGAYICFMDMYKPQKEVLIGLRNRETKQIMGLPVVPKQEWLITVICSYERMIGILNGKINPNPIGNIFKCQRCKSYLDCPYKLF